jgi:polar amino acid transport system substrate-binding protein
MRAVRLLASWALLAALVSCGRPQGTSGLWASSTLKQAKDRGKLVVALEAAFKPFEYIDESGELAGFDVDLARIIGKEMEIPVEFKNVHWDGIIPSLLEHKADLIISGMTATPLRALRVSYSAPYFHTIICWLVSKQRAPGVKGLVDLDAPGRVIAVKQGTTGDIVAGKRCPNAEIRRFDDDASAALEVALGRADALLFDLRAVQNHHRAHPDTTYLVREAVSVEPYAIACRKGDPDTVAWLDLLLHHMRRDGRLEDLYAKYDLENVESGD